MKITIFINSLAGGGAERVVSHLLTYFYSKGIKIQLVLMEDIVSYQLPPDIQITILRKNKRKESNYKKFFELPLLAYYYARILNENKTDISISFLTRPNFINLGSKLFSRKTKRIIGERSNPSLQYDFKTIKGYINSIIIKHTYHLSDGIIANSNGNSLDLHRNFSVPLKLIKKIYNPIDINIIEKTEVNLNFFDKNYFNFVSVGRLDSGKNHKLLINAMNLIPNKNIRLYIFGDGPSYNLLNNLISNLKLQNQVFLKGFTREIFTYLKSADCFLFGSNHEGFPNVILEAMACELPIISTDCPFGPAEIMKNIETDTKNHNVSTRYGILVPVDSIKDMALAINKMVENKMYYNKCKDNVFFRAKDFDIDIIMNEYFEYITSFQK